MKHSSQFKHVFELLTLSAALVIIPLAQVSSFALTSGQARPLVIQTLDQASSSGDASDFVGIFTSEHAPDESFQLQPPVSLLDQVEVRDAGSGEFEVKIKTFASSDQSCEFNGRAKLDASASLVATSTDPDEASIPHGSGRVVGRIVGRVADDEERCEVRIEPLHPFVPKGADARTRAQDQIRVVDNGNCQSSCGLRATLEIERANRK